MVWSGLVTTPDTFFLMVKVIREQKSGQSDLLFPSCLCQSRSAPLFSQIVILIHCKTKLLTVYLTIGYNFEIQLSLFENV